MKAKGESDVRESAMAGEERAPKSQRAALLLSFSG